MSILSDNSDDFLKKSLIPLIRKTLPGLIASDICGVQPMTGPSGSIFSMTSKYTMFVQQEIPGYDEWLQKTNRTDCARSVDTYIEELIWN